MSDRSQGPGWWQASDGRWYPPEQSPGLAQPVPPTPYGTPGGYAGPPETDTQATVSLVIGIAGLVTGWLCCIAYFVSPVAIYLGYASKKRIAESDGRLKGTGMATAGFVLGIIGTVLGILVFVFFATVGSWWTVGTS